MCVKFCSEKSVPLDAFFWRNFVKSNEILKKCGIDVQSICSEILEIDAQWAQKWEEKILEKFSENCTRFLWKFKILIVGKKQKIKDQRDWNRVEGQSECTDSSENLKMGHEWLMKYEVHILRMLKSARNRVKSCFFSTSESRHNFGFEDLHGLLSEPNAGVKWKYS